MTINYIGPSMRGGTRDEAKCTWFEKGKRADGWFEFPMLSKA